MKKCLSCVLLLIIILLSCACGASKDAAVEIADSFEMAMDGYSYSMERSIGEESPIEEDCSEVAVSTYSDAIESRTVVEASEKLVYVTFSQRSDDILDENGGKVFIYQCYEPAIVAEDDKVNAWLASVVNNAAQITANEIACVEEQALNDLQSREEDGPSFYTHSYYSNVTTERLDNHVISALQVNSVYSGGAHPNNAQIAYNLDIQNQKVLKLADVILPGAEDALKQRVLDELSGRFGGLENSGLYPDYAEIVSSSFEGSNLTANWYFTEDSFVIYFNCYDIAPYAAGIIKIAMPYESLGRILCPAYFPDNSAAGEGSVTHIHSLDGRQILNNATDGYHFYVGTEEEISDVKLYRITGWITNDVPIVGQMMFAANRLSALDALSLRDNGGFDHLLTYKNREGRMVKIAISATELMEIVAEVAE